MMIVTGVSAEPPATLSVTLSNGRRFEVDVAAYATSPGHEALAEPATLATVEVDEWGHGVHWPSLDLGVDVDTLVRLHKEQTGQAFPVDAFNAWMSRNHLSLTAAAQALGLTRRAIVYYHGGHRPIPKLVGLACKGWEVQARETAA